MKSLTKERLKEMIVLNGPVSCSFERLIDTFGYKRVDAVKAHENIQQWARENRVFAHYFDHTDTYRFSI